MAVIERWTGRTGFILATIGSAIGLGSVWKFPYEAGANGGGAFVLCYLAGLAIIVVPLMLAEFAIGRRGRADAAESLAALAIQAGRSPRWGLVGALGILTGFLILSFYSVIGGWTLAYAVDAAHDGIGSGDPAAIRADFDALLASPARLIAGHAAFLAITAVVVGAGVVAGIEAACKILMPALLAMMAALAVHAVVVGDAAAAFRFLFAFDPARLTARAALDAVGLGFFSIGVGLGLMVTYAAYAGETIRLGEIAVVTLVGDTLVSFLAGIAIFPLVFAHGLDPASGPGLMFITLPIAFARMPGGATVAIAFYLLLFLSALASAISLLELAVAWLMRRVGLSRRWTAAALGAACFAAGIPTVLSFNLWAGWHPLAVVPRLANAGFFDVLDFLTSDVMLPLGGALLAVFAGWIVPGASLANELRLSPRGAAVLGAMLRWVVPLGIAAVALASLAR
ncbi:MAG: sodium-dependent transporter [Alphaproteobacteria bacterium]|nr:sodium-dependent transporter [Alphaproteobacteria bacterium]